MLWTYATAYLSAGRAAGMLEGLPEDVQMLLRRRGPPRGPSAAPLDLAIEARDARTASDLVFQFLAFR